jgi:uncharacterized membrane protein YkoI
MLLAAAAVLLVVGCKSANRESREHEEEVTLDQVPPAVKETLSRESGGAPMGTVHRETEKGRVVYEARITKAGKTYEVEVDESGKVLEREEAGKEDEED